MKIHTLVLILVSGLFTSCEEGSIAPDPITILAPGNLQPADMEVLKEAFVSFSWDTVAHGDQYELWVDSSDSFNDPLQYKSEHHVYAPEDSFPNNTYRWKVRASNDSIQSPWSDVNEFTVDVDVIEENIILIPGSELELLSSSQNFSFLEGPAYDGENLLYFTDIPNENIVTYHLQTKAFQVFRAFSNRSNGLMFARDGRLIACEGGSGKVVAHNASGIVEEVLADTYNGTRFNAPNDLVIDRTGGIYFTDPTWSDPHQDVFGVYYRAPDGTVNRLVNDMDKPNGVILSPGGDRIYINDSNSKTVRVYDVVAPGDLSASYESITLNSTSGNNTGADGMAMDTKGNLYVTTKMGVQVFDQELVYLLTIELPEIPANCTFGGSDLRTLFITARTNLYSIKLHNPGVMFPLTE